MDPEAIKEIDFLAREARERIDAIYDVLVRQEEMADLMGHENIPNLSQYPLPHEKLQRGPRATVDEANKAKAKMEQQLNLYRAAGLHIPEHIEPIKVPMRPPDWAMDIPEADYEPDWPHVYEGIEHPERAPWDPSPNLPRGPYVDEDVQQSFDPYYVDPRAPPPQMESYMAPVSKEPQRKVPPRRLRSPADRSSHRRFPAPVGAACPEAVPERREPRVEAPPQRPNLPRGPCVDEDVQQSFDPYYVDPRAPPPQMESYMAPVSEEPHRKAPPRRLKSPADRSSPRRSPATVDAACPEVVHERRGPRAEAPPQRSLKSPGDRYSPMTPRATTGSACPEAVPETRGPRAVAPPRRPPIAGTMASPDVLPERRVPLVEAPPQRRLPAVGSMEDPDVLPERRVPRVEAPPQRSFKPPGVRFAAPMTPPAAAFVSVPEAIPESGGPRAKTPPRRMKSPASRGLPMMPPPAAAFVACPEAASQTRVPRVAERPPRRMKSPADRSSPMRPPAAAGPASHEAESQSGQKLVCEVSQIIAQARARVDAALRKTTGEGLDPESFC